jgi:hypothetical protein
MMSLVICTATQNFVIESKEMRWAGHVAGMVEKNTYRVLVRKPE